MFERRRNPLGTLVNLSPFSPELFDPCNFLRIRARPAQVIVIGRNHGCETDTLGVTGPCGPLSYGRVPRLRFGGIQSTFLTEEGRQQCVGCVKLTNALLELGQPVVIVRKGCQHLEGSTF